MLALYAHAGIGAVVALTLRSAGDDPVRVHSSKKVGPWAGRTPSRNQSGERNVSGHIKRPSDATVPRALCQTASVMITRGPSTWLRKRAVQNAHRRGRRKCSITALARRVAVVPHRVLRDGTNPMRRRRLKKSA